MRSKIRKIYFDYRKSFENLKEEWLTFMLLTNSGHKNQDLLDDYFFNQFAKNKNYFYYFLVFLKQYLHYSEDKKIKKKIAHQYLKTISVLCEKFGFPEEKNDLDVLCFKIVDLRGYKKIAKELVEYKRKSNDTLQRILEKINNLLKSKAYKFNIQGRYKNAYSIYQKINKKQFKKKPRELRDVFAFRIIVLNNKTRHCFEILNLLHNKFYPLPDHFKDYISIPKINGYQSLHTTLNEVLSELDLPVEIQIRTQEMDDFAERGTAAHAIYALNKNRHVDQEKAKKMITQPNTLKNNAYIYCFSDNGDLFKINKESRIIDFAYKIHSKLGNKMKFAIVNGERQEMDYKIQEGDVIKIVKSKVDLVNIKWLGLTKNKDTHRKINHAIRQS